MLSNKVFLITGTSRGIGLGLTRRLLEHSQAKVIATYRTPDGVAALTRLSESFADRLIILPLDVTDRNQFHVAKQHLFLRGINSIDAVIANAGIATPDFGGDQASSTTIADMDRIFQTNVGGVMNTFQVFQDLVLASPSRLFCVVSSIMGSLTFVDTTGIVGMTSYRTSKCAVNMFSLCFGNDPAIKAAGGKVICLNPGWVRTDLGGPQAKLSVDDSAMGLLRVVEIAMATQTNESVEVPPSYEEAKALIKEKQVAFISHSGKILSW